MNWLVDIGLFALVGICSYFGIEHHLDSKANKLSQGNEEDRRDADAQVEAASKWRNDVGVTPLILGI